MITMCTIYFLDIYQTPLGNKNVQLIASNALVVEAYGLEYRTLGRLTQTFTICIEEPRDKLKWCTADNKSI